MVSLWKEYVLWSVKWSHECTTITQSLIPCLSTETQQSNILRQTNKEGKTNGKTKFWLWFQRVFFHCLFSCMVYVHTGPTLVDLYERLTRASNQQDPSAMISAETSKWPSSLICSVAWVKTWSTSFWFLYSLLCLFSRWPYQWMGSWPPRATHRKTTPCWARMISFMWVGAPALLICLDLLSATTSWVVSRR